MQLEKLFGGVCQIRAVDNQCCRLIGRHHLEIRKTVNDQRLNSSEAQRITGDGENTTSGKSAAGNVSRAGRFAIAGNTQRIANSVR